MREQILLMHNIWPDKDLRFYREQKGRYVAFIEDICELIGFVRALDTGAGSDVTGSWCAPRAAEAAAFASATGV